MILADTSAWVEYDRSTGSPADARLTELIAADGPVAVTEPIVMEVLAEARSDKSTRIYLHLADDWLAAQYRKAAEVIDAQVFAGHLGGPGARAGSGR